MNINIRSILWVVALVILLILMILSAGFFWLRSSLPQTTGTIDIPGLQQPVEVVRDGNAVPHIYAKNNHDLYMAFGFIQAQDRLWQMHLQRSIAAGRLTELVGARRDSSGVSTNIETDKLFRTMGVYRASEKAWKYLSAETQAELQAFSDGVNAYLKTRKGPLPPEFLATGVTEIRPWTPIDSISWQKMLMWDMGSNRNTEMSNFVLSSQYSSEDLSTLVGTYPGDEPFYLPDLNKLYDRKPNKTAWNDSTILGLSPYERPKSDGVGSNNWVASGKITQSGFPLLANDPHLRSAAPSLWYYAGLYSAEDDFKVLGAVLPGIPYVILGRTDTTAWGFTNTDPDVQDFFLEKINPNNADEYLTPIGYKKLKHFKETIVVPGEDNITLDVRETRHGPVMSDLWPQGDSRRNALPNKNTVMAFSWTGLIPKDTTMTATRMLSRVKDIDQISLFDSVMVAPMQNIVWANTAGETLYIAAAKVPIRGKNNLTSGMAPALGWDKDYDWQSFIPVKDLPKIINPMLRVTANNKIVTDTYPYFLSREWTPPYRSNRISSLLEKQTSPLSVDIFKKSQLDMRANQAADIVPTMIARIKPKIQNRGGLYDDALTELSHWADLDFEASKSSSAMPIYATWYRNFMIDVIHDELAQIYPDAMSYRALFVRELLLGSPKGADPSRWCGTLPDKPGSKVDCDNLLTKAFIDAVDTLSTQYGKNVAQWNWGEIHQSVSKNPVLGGIPFVRKFANIIAPIGGSNASVNVHSYSLSNSPDTAFHSTHSPSLRNIFDFANLDDSLFIYQLGQSGNLFSQYYSNFFEDWSEGRYQKLSMNREKDIVPGNIGILQLVPK